ncbi:MAG: YkgJ family cysteine cluster protein [Desulfobacterales bacterium]|nr:MAG: YkgJ family cysteine cluster protein [Desulfobacterales bacterium]
MKYFDIEEMDNLPGVRIKEGDTFRFRCHPDVGCFNRCCHNLNLFLYPYDVLRLKQFLQMSSDAFLDKYVDIVMRPSNYFPEVLLRMSDNTGNACPFVGESGCAVYDHRPDTCRNFPVEQGVLYNAAQRKAEPVYFFRPPDFCLGKHETQVWRITDWVADQETEQYYNMTIRWAELKKLFQKDPWGFEGPEGPRAKMAFMATYNIDRFRDFVFQSSFLKRYLIKSTLRKQLKTDDAALLKFGFEWVKVFIWGMQSKDIKQK